MLISLNDISKYYGATLILENINLVIEDNDRIGLIGINGAGKSTLLNIIEGSLDFESGTKNLGSNFSMGFLKQNSGLNSSSTIEKEMQSVFNDVNKAMESMNRLFADMSKIPQNTSEYTDALSRYNELQAFVDAKDGYNINVKINKILTGMGFSDKPSDTVISTLSGGEKTRLALCKLLLEEPKLLILDEPTNHLDFKTLTWLEDYLKTYKGALLIVSHDRFFLDNLVTSMCEIEDHKMYRYPGNYTQYLTLKDERIARMQKVYDSQQSEIKKLEDYVDKNLTRASTSNMAKSRRKTLEKMELVEKPPAPAKKAKLRFDYKIEPVKDILHVNDLCLSVGSENDRRKLMQHFELDVMRGEKVALIGENGVGKSSFLKAIQDIIPIDSGNIKWGKNVKISYFDQENGDLNFEKTALNEIWDRYPSVYETEIRNILGSVLITGEECYKPVSKLSGGERAKLKFALIMMEKGNVLILDEPTNHLDLNTKEVLDKALNEFTGTIIMVSHDRYLLSKVPTKIVEITSDGKTEYKGNYYYYLEQQKNQETKKEQTETIKNAKIDSAAKTGYNKSREQRSLLAALRREKTQLETTIEETENLISRLEEDIASPELAADYEKLNEVCLKVENLRTLLDKHYERWTEISDLIPE